MGLFDFFKSKKKRDEDEAALAFLMAISRHQSTMRADAVETDSLPTGYGPFGLCVTNPIPTQSVLGSRVYLAALRTANNRPVDSNRIGSCNAPDDVTTAMIDMYQLTSQGQDLATIYICPYHQRNSACAPEGFLMATEQG